MAANSRTNATFRDRYWTGDIADAPSDGEIFVDSTNTNRITVFRGGSWATPQFDTITLTGTTTVTTLTSTTINNSGTTTTADGTVGSTLVAQRVQVAGVASLADAQVVALTIPTPAASPTGKVVLGNAAVPTTATSTSGFIQISALPGTPVGQTAEPAANTVFLSFDTTRLAIVAKVGSAWYATASMSIY